VDRTIKPLIRLDLLELSTSADKWLLVTPRGRKTWDALTRSRLTRVRYREHRRGARTRARSSIATTSTAAVLYFGRASGRLA
jgi:hypothetical protein